MLIFEFSSIILVISWWSVNLDYWSYGTERSSSGYDIFSIYGTGRLSGSRLFSVDLANGTYASSCKFYINYSPSVSSLSTTGLSL